MFLLVPAYPGSPGQKALKWLSVCVYMLGEWERVLSGNRPVGEITCPGNVGYHL